MAESALTDEEADHACLREQVMGYRKDLAMCRKVFQWIVFNAEQEKVARVAERAVREMKQR